MTVHVNDNCIGCGLCVNMCGNVFLMTEEGVAAARDEIFPEQEAPAQEAAESCPVQAIEIHEKTSITRPSCSDFLPRTEPGQSG